jgi:hypothetical protein
MLFIEIRPRDSKLEVSLCEKKMYTVECLDTFVCEPKNVNREIETLLVLTNNLTTKEKL